MEVQPAKCHGESTSTAGHLSHKINKVSLLLQSLGIECNVFSNVTMIQGDQKEVVSWYELILNPKDFKTHWLIMNICL